MKKITIRFFDSKCLILVRRWFKRRSVSKSEKKLINKLAKTEKSATEVSRSQLAAMQELAVNLEKATVARVRLLQEVNDSRSECVDLRADVDNLRLTIDEQNEYISQADDASRKKDTENGLMALELETLTLWRESINQQLRTEAEINAARSRVLQGRDANKVLENMKNADQTKDDGGKVR